MLSARQERKGTWRGAGVEESFIVGATRRGDTITLECAPSAAHYVIALTGRDLSDLTEPKAMAMGDKDPVVLRMEGMPLADEEVVYVAARYVPVDQPLDSDGDGIDDLYEIREEELDPLDGRDAANVPEGDGVSHYERYLAHVQSTSRQEVLDDPERDGSAGIQPSDPTPAEPAASTDAEQPRIEIAEPEGVRPVVEDPVVIESLTPIRIDDALTGPTVGGTLPRAVLVTGWDPPAVNYLGMPITISGQNLPSGPEVWVGDIQLPVRSASSSTIIVDVPETLDNTSGPLVVRRGERVIWECTDTYVLKARPPEREPVEEPKRDFTLFMHESGSHKILNSYLLSVISRHVYEDGMGVSGWSAWSNRFTATYRDYDFSSVNCFRDVGVVIEVWEAGPLNPGIGGFDTQYAVLANDDVIIVAFRGSESGSADKFLTDWKHTDFNRYPEMVHAWKEGAWVHRGVKQAYERIAGPLEDHLDALEQRRPGRPIFLTGHSLGASLSHMAGYQLKRRGYPVRAVYSFAAFRLGNARWREAYHEQGLGNVSHRWVNKLDLVPRYPGLPLSITDPWTHVGVCNNIYRDHSIHINDREQSFNLSWWRISDHNMSEYAREIFNDLTRRYPSYKEIVPPPPR